MSIINFSDLTIPTTIIASIFTTLTVNAQEKVADSSLTLSSLSPKLERSANLLVSDNAEAISEQSQAQKLKNWSVIPNVSTLGIGGSVVGKIAPQLNGRVGVNAFGFDLTYEETLGSYDAEVDLFNITTALDYYPFKKSGFHTSIGVIYANNNADGVASASDIFDVNIGGLNFGVDDLVDVNAEVETSRNFAPYLGIGWGNPIARNWGIWANVGVMFPGSPQVELAPNYKFDPDILPANLQQDIQDALDEEERAIEEELDRFNVYPIISVGLTYSF